MVDGFRYRARRVGALVAAAVMVAAALTTVVAAPQASAFSREGLPVEQLGVPSPSMGRDINVAVPGRRAAFGAVCSTAFAPRTTPTGGTSTPRRSSGSTSPASRW